MTIEGEDLGGRPTFETGESIHQYTLSTPTMRGFRVPFPAEGTVSLQTSWWSVPAGEFTPTWKLAGEQPVSETAKALSSVSRSAGQISVLLDGDPSLVLHLQDDELTTETIEFPSNTDPVARRLYVTESGELAAFALTTDSSPVILNARRSESGEWTVESTGIQTTEDPEDDVVIAGGRGGGVVWFRTWLEEDGIGAGGAGGSDGTDGIPAWIRARSLDGSWEVDAGPIIDSAYGRKKYAAGATSDGSLYVAYAVDASTFFDTMEQPVMRRLAPDDTEFGPALPAGTRVDDYVNSISLIDRGEGLVVGYCARDVSVFSAKITCYEGLAPAEGERTLRVSREGSSTRHALSLTTSASFVCDSNDDFALHMRPSDISEPVAWPCPRLLATVIDTEGQPLALVWRHDVAQGLVPR